MANPEFATSSLIERVHLVRLRETMSWLAHELAQPLAAMGSYMGAAERLLDEDSPPRARGAISNGLLQLERVRSVLQTTRSNLGPSDESEVTVTDLLGTVCRHFGVTPPEPTTEPGGELPSSLVPADLQVALYELVHNAQEALGANVGSLTGAHDCANVAMRARLGDELVIELVNATTQSPAPGWFTAFYTTREHHLGMGLTVARQLAERMGGSLEADSKAPNEVSFQLRIPIRGR